MLQKAFPPTFSSFSTDKHPSQMCLSDNMRYLLVWAVMCKLLSQGSGQLSMPMSSMKAAQSVAEIGLSSPWANLLNSQYGSSQPTTTVNLPGNTNYFGTQFLAGEATSLSPQRHQLMPQTSMGLAHHQQGLQPQATQVQGQGQKQNQLFNNYLTYPSYLQAISSDVFNPFGTGNPYNNVTASTNQAPLQAVGAFPGLQQNFLPSSLTLPSTWSALSPQTFQPLTRAANFQPAPNAGQSGNALLNTNYLSQFTFPYGQGQFGYPLTFGQNTNPLGAPAQSVQQPKPVIENKKVQQAPPPPPIKHSRPGYRGERPRNNPHTYESDEDTKEPETYRIKPNYEESEESDEEDANSPSYRSTKYQKHSRPSEEDEEDSPEDLYEESTSVNSKNCDNAEEGAGFSASNFEEQFKSFPTNSNFRDPDFSVESSNVKEVATPIATDDEEEDAGDDDSDSSDQRIPSTLHYYNYKPPKYNRHNKAPDYFPNNPFKKPKSEHSVASHKRAPKNHKDSVGHHPSTKAVYMVKKMY